MYILILFYMFILTNLRISLGHTDHTLYLYAPLNQDAEDAKVAGDSSTDLVFRLIGFDLWLDQQVMPSRYISLRLVRVDMHTIVRALARLSGLTTRPSTTKTVSRSASTPLRQRVIHNTTCGC